MQMLALPGHCIKQGCQTPCILMAIPRGRHYHPHFTDGETEAQRGHAQTL